MQRLARLVRHLWQSPAAVRRRFTAEVLDAVEAAVRRAESDHGGEVRFVIETDLSAGAVLRGCSARDRAIEVFSATRVWDTEQNNGVLVYVLWADRAVEIVADRGLNGRVTAADWAQVSQLMEREFRAGNWLGGAVSGVDAVGRLLAQHFPTGPQNPNELPDRPLFL